ncbi:hypothetical protein CDD81_1367 [Ophiocordyceps australis]|uniref:alpha-glucosidase n=1 Tax=Ophiocordyceps australis TaxID=1399860 RepID=A0A2C5Y1C0_9HYPO|nr:hypothetical protein CDD81_1367 [Ophiocordyceps australis]
MTTPCESTVGASMHHERAHSPYVGGRKGDKYRFTVLEDGLVRYEWASDAVFEDRPSSLAYRRAESLQHTPPYKLRESANSIEIITSRFHLNYDKQEFAPGGLWVTVFGHTGSVWRFGEANDTLGGTARTLDGIDGRIAMGSGVVSRKGFAYIDDSESMLFTSDGFVASRRPGPGRVDGYLFCYGHDYPEAIRALWRLSGPQPLLPRWSLGNWWSRYYAYSAQSYLELMDKFHEHKVPLSVAVIDMDWHLVDDPRVIEAGQSGWTGYTWNRKLFPDPPAFIKQLHERRLKVTLNDHPSDGVQPYEDIYSSMARKLHRDPSSKEAIPFDIADVDFLNAYFDPLLRSIEKDGVDFWWIDWQQGRYSRLRGVDPLWMLNHYHYVKWPRHHLLPIILSRYAGPGSHRYPIGFSGDTIVSWASLDFQSEFTATASNIGYGWWSHDIGGHMFGIHDDDLTVRWVQLGVLSPIMRLHSTKSQWVGKEPWKLPAGPRQVVTNMMRLRHRLIPYLDTMNVRATDVVEGSPIVQPMYWKYPERDEAYEVPNQYHFGTSMLVAPITTPQNRVTKTAKVRAWLPPGTYVDFFTGVVYSGNRTMWLSRTLDKIPVLLKQGAIVPLDADETPSNGGGKPESLELVVVVGAEGHFELLEEDVEESGLLKQDASRADNASLSTAKTVKWIKTPIWLKQNDGTITIGATRGGSSPPKTRNWSVRLLGVRSVKDLQVSVQGKSFKPKSSIADNGLVVHLGAVASNSSVMLSLGSDPQLSANDAQALAYPILFDAQVEYNLKDKIGAIMDAKGVPAGVRVSQLESLDMDQDLRLILTEFLLAQPSLS